MEELLAGNEMAGNFTLANLLQYSNEKALANSNTFPAGSKPVFAERGWEPVGMGSELAGSVLEGLRASWDGL